MLPTQLGYNVEMVKNAVQACIALIVSVGLSVSSPISRADDQWNDLNRQVLEHYKSADYAQSVAWSEKALAHAQQVFGETHPKTLLAMFNLAGLLEITGDYDKAESLAEKSLKLRREHLGETDAQTLTSMDQLAGIYQKQGRLDQAKSVFIETLALRTTVMGARHPDTLISMQNLASYYRQQGWYGKAQALQTEVTDLFRLVLGERDINTITSINNLAILYRTQGKYKQAEVLFTEALGLKKSVSGEKNSDTLGMMHNLASVYADLNQFDQAEALFKKTLSLKSLVLGDGHPETLLSLNNLANLYLKQDKYKKAEPILNRALALSRTVHGNQHPDTLVVMNNLAVLYDSQDLRDRSVPLMIELVNLSEQVLGANHPNTLLAMNNLASAYFKAGKFEKAEVISDRALAATQTFLMQILPALSEKDRQDYLHQQDDFTGLYLSVFSHRPSAENAMRALSLSLNRKALQLQIATEVRALSRTSTDPQLAELMELLKFNRQKLSTLVLTGQALSPEIETLQDTIDQQQGQISRQIKQPPQNSLSVTPQQVIHALDKDSIFIDYLIYWPYSPNQDKAWQDAHVLALVVSAEAEDPILMSKLGKLAPIQQAIERYWRALNNPHSIKAENKKLALNLYQALFSKFEDRLIDKQRLYIAVDGYLNVLPFASLVDDSGQYLIKQFQITMLSTGRDLVLPEADANASAPVIVAAPLYDDEQIQDYKDQKIVQAKTSARVIENLYFSALPGTLKEGDAIFELFNKHQQNTVYYKLEQASEANVKAVQSPRILHLATHGFFLQDLKVDQRVQANKLHRGALLIEQDAAFKGAGIATQVNPLLRSGLAFTDANREIESKSGNNGILTAAEVLDLELKGTELVVLSACETGVGEIYTGEGVYGLKRAFQQAGAQSVLSTLWSISDTSTSTFMSDFYRRYLGGSQAQQALRDTQLEFIDNKQWSHPYYWAAFVMVGN